MQLFELLFSISFYIEPSSVVRFEFIKLQQISTPHNQSYTSKYVLCNRWEYQSVNYKIMYFFAMFVICLPTKHLEVLKNSFRRVCASQIMRWNLEVLVFEERRKREYQGEKALGAKDRTDNKINPYMVSTLGFECRPH